jgi:hypothetical protein
VTASRLAEVGAGDPQPLELGGLGEHPPEQLPVGGLELGALGESAACRGNPRRQGIADLLQLAEADHARLPRSGGNARIDGEARKALRREPGELSFEAADLTPQLGTGESLVALCANAGEDVSVEQLLHEPIRV